MAVPLSLSFEDLSGDLFEDLVYQLFKKILGQELRQTRYTRGCCDMFYEGKVSIDCLNWTEGKIGIDVYYTNRPDDWVSRWNRNFRPSLRERVCQQLHQLQNQNVIDYFVLVTNSKLTKKNKDDITLQVSEDTKFPFESIWLIDRELLIRLLEEYDIAIVNDDSLTSAKARRSVLEELIELTKVIQSNEEDQANKNKDIAEL